VQATEVTPEAENIEAATIISEGGTAETGAPNLGAAATRVD
jgi:hypothetical protein